MLIEHLPSESATMTALRNANPASVSEDGPDPADGPWSQLEMLAATLVDEMRYLRYVYTAANAGKGRKPSPPEPVRRPGVEKKTARKPRMSADQADFLWRHINGIQQDPDSPIRFQPT